MSAALRRTAETEAAEVKSWTCQSCDVMVEEDGEHCAACRQYWNDVRDGMFEEEYNYE